MNWKNLKLGNKIALGFAIVLVLTIVVGVFSYSGFNNVRTHIDESNEFVLLEESVYQAMSERKNFMINSDQQSVDNWNKVMNELYVHIEELRNKIGDNNEVVDINDLVKDADLYKEAFLHFVESRENENKVAVEWKSLGEQFFTVIDNTKRNFSDQDVLLFIAELENKFALMRIGAIYYIKDKTEQRWIEFEAAMSNMKQTAGKSDAYGSEFQSQISEVNGIVDSYIAQSNNFYNFVQQENEDNKKMAEAAGEFLQIVKDANDKQQEIMQNEILQVVSLIIMVIVFALLIGSIIAFIITRSITRPIIKGVDFAKAVADGDLTVNVEIDQKDEVGILAASLRGMVQKLSDIVISIMAGSDNIASASEQLSSSSQEMSEGASEQASSAEEVSSSMEQMSANIQQNTDNAQQTEKIAINASEGMNKVANAAKESLDSTRKIAEKITIVNDIAFQTNILALNAAVEAARAGEHGKGFAVVAAEVRKLAERSKVAADEINELSGRSLKVTEEAGELMMSIIPEIEKTAKLVQEISAASLEQSSGADQVNSAIQQLNTVTQQNAAASEEMATSSEELASQAQQLKEIISYFRIEGKRQSQESARKKLVEFQNKENDSEESNSKNKQISHGKASEKGIDIQLPDNDKLDNEFESF